MAQARPCYFHQRPGGCRNGSACRFYHGEVPAPGAPAPPRPPPHGPRAFGPPARGPAPRFPGLLSQEEYLAGVPPGTCRFFWTQGTCKRGNRCKYVHVTPTQADSDSDDAASDAASDATVTLLSDDRLTAIASGESSDIVRGPTHFDRGFMNRLLASNGSGYFGSGTFDMCKLAEALLASTEETSTWVSSKGSRRRGACLCTKSDRPGSFDVSLARRHSTMPRASSSTSSRRHRPSPESPRSLRLRFPRKQAGTARSCPSSAASSRSSWYVDKTTLHARCADRLARMCST